MAGVTDFFHSHRKTAKKMSLRHRPQARQVKYIKRGVMLILYPPFMKDR
ncbi:MAG: hypothetical protein JWR03_1638 [Cohnella sp.]|jgi:hypothetical protein|nr:hypothetical protein [Cohnella sp.]